MEVFYFRGHDEHVATKASFIGSLIAKTDENSSTTEPEAEIMSCLTPSVANEVTGQHSFLITNYSILTLSSAFFAFLPHIDGRLKRAVHQKQAEAKPNTLQNGIRKQHKSHLSMLD